MACDLPVHPFFDTFVLRALLPMNWFAGLALESLQSLASYSNNPETNDV